MCSDSIDRSLLEAVANGQAVFFLGAGVSLLPPGSRTSEKDRVGLREKIIADFAGTLRDMPYDREELSLEDLVFYLRAHKGVSAAQIGTSVREFLVSGPELAALESFKLLRRLFLARPRVIEAIITTNWDAAIEESLSDIAGVEVQCLIDDDDCLQYDPQKLSLLKIHGDASKPESIVLSTLDFDLYERTHPRIVERLRILFATKFVVLLGYSARDENFRRIFRTLHYDLGERAKGGWLIAPEIGDREGVWMPTVGLLHAPTTASNFLSQALAHIARIPLGMSRKVPLPTDREDVFFDIEDDLSDLAKRVKSRFSLKEVWVSRLPDSERPNVEAGRLAAFYLEIRCGKIRTLALGTGETMSAISDLLDPKSFSRPLTIFSTIVLLAGPSGFRDPSHLVQKLVGRFVEGKAKCFSLRLPGREYLAQLKRLTSRDIEPTLETLRTIGREHVLQAMSADVVIGSSRPADWYGGGGVPSGRTRPFQSLWQIGRESVDRALAKADAIGIHHMIPIDGEGNDAMRSGRAKKHLGSIDEYAQRPQVADLRKAAKSGTQKVILVGAHHRKVISTRAILKGGLANVAILDEDLANALLRS